MKLLECLEGCLGQSDSVCVSDDVDDSNGGDGEEERRKLKYKEKFTQKRVYLFPGLLQQRTKD